MAKEQSGKNLIAIINDVSFVCEKNYVSFVCDSFPDLI